MRTLLCRAAALGFFTVFSLQARAQEASALDSVLLADDARPTPVAGTFKSTRIINNHSVETLPAGILDFRMLHRFGTVNGGVRELFGLDQATSRFGFDYGVTDWLTLGVGRSSFQKEYDGYAKVRLLRQRSGGGLPVTVTYVGAASVRTDRSPFGDGDTREWFFSNRLAYANQLLIARRFSRTLSLQLMPTHVHYNLVPLRTDGNDLLALGFGGRVRMSRRVALTGEWHYRLPSTTMAGTRNPLSVGVDIETGSHVFQLHFTNAPGITERAFLGQTTGSWGDGDVRFGFNLSRVFTVRKQKGTEDVKLRVD